jgi:hypothetical protein
MCPSSVFLWIQLTSWSCFSSTVGWDSPDSRATSHDELLRGSRSTNYNCVIFLGWCPYSLWATYIQVCHRCYSSCLKKTLFQPSKHITVWMMSTGVMQWVFSVQQYQLDCYRYRGLRACRCIRRVRIPLSVDRNWPLGVLTTLISKVHNIITFSTIPRSGIKNISYCNSRMFGNSKYAELSESCKFL